MRAGKKTMTAVLAVLLLGQTVLGAQDYEKAQRLATRFFGAQRCGGNAKSWIGHDACHWHDANINGVDLEGGWHDCGDHIKFAITGGYAAGVLLHSYINFPGSHEDNYSFANSEGGANGIPDVLDEVKHYTDYAMKLIQGDKMYYQVGQPSEDHTSPSTPVYQTENEASGTRQAFYVSGSGGSNVAGTHAAVLAMMSIAYEPYDASYATQCLEKAKEFYAFGNASKGTVNTADFGTEDNGPYSDATWADDMAFGAIQLYRATKETDYIVDANGFVGLANFSMPTWFVLDYSSVAPLVAYDIAKDDVLPSAGTQKENLMREATSYIDSMSSAGFSFFASEEGLSWGSMKFAAAAAYVGMLAYDLSPDSVQFKDLALSNVDFILGDHAGFPDAPSGFSFLSGYGSDYPMGQIHHAAAFGGEPAVFGSNYGQWGDISTQNEYDLVGALVGGPKYADGSGYDDYRNDAVTNEVGIYYNAPLVAVLAAINDPGEQENVAPSDITLSSSSVSANSADAVVGALTAVDANVGDSHTFSLVSGSDNFKISGGALVTAAALAKGEYTVKIKVTDSGGLTYEKTFTISVIDGALKDGENVAGYLGWYTYLDALGSTQDTSGGLVQNDSIAGVTFTMESSDTENEDYVYACLAAELKTDLSSPNFIIIEYSTTGDFNFVLPHPAVTDDAHYFAGMQNTSGSWVRDTFNLSTADFSQPSWGTSVDFDKSSVNSLEFATNFEGTSGEIKIRSLQIEGLSAGDVPVSKTAVSSKTAGIQLTSVSTSGLNLSVSSGGTYNLRLYSLDGRKLGQIVSRLSAGENSVSMPGSAQYPAGVMLLQVEGAGMNSVMKFQMK
ncbi:MAG: glycoside hydrolase family 9 protein [Fibrobacterota bacterium]